MGADRQRVRGKEGKTLDTVGGRQTDSEGEGGRDTRHRGGQTDREGEGVRDTRHSGGQTDRQRGGRRERH